MNSNRKTGQGANSVGSAWHHAVSCTGKEFSCMHQYWALSHIKWPFIVILSCAVLFLQPNRYPQSMNCPITSLPGQLRVDVSWRVFCAGLSEGLSRWKLTTYSAPNPQSTVKVQSSRGIAHNPSLGSAYGWIAASAWLRPFSFNIVWQVQRSGVHLPPTLSKLT